MVIEVKVPDNWTPGLALATAELLRRTMKEGLPIVVAIRADATADEVEGVYDGVRDLIREAGMTA